MKKRVLILDYSVNKRGALAIKQWIPNNADTSVLLIDTKESFPSNLIEKDFTHVIHTGSALSITEEAPFTKRAENYIRGHT